MDNNELRRANELKEIELKLKVWRELYEFGKVDKAEYIKVLGYAMKLVEKNSRLEES